MSPSAAKIVAALTSLPMATGVGTTLFIPAEISNAVSPSFSLPAPVIEPIIGYGTIFTAALAMLGMVGMFYGMKYTLQHVVDELKQIKEDLKEFHETQTKVQLNMARISEHARRIQSLENKLYLNDAAVSFGRTAATRSGVFIDQRNEEGRSGTED